MKKMYETPEMEVLEMSSAPMMIEGSGIDMGGTGDPDAKMRIDDLIEDEILPSTIDKDLLPFL
ncbi:MAG: hypothetical protein IJ693_08175 [Bacteroidaceae bacterium]|nr:hypothetical protein [Bacteroidaceae bacterium]MBR1668240.1 hypothetical protein [Bacteroidaceae bacterium]